MPLAGNGTQLFKPVKFLFAIIVAFSFYKRFNFMENLQTVANELMKKLAEKVGLDWQTRLPLKNIKLTIEKQKNNKF